MAEITLADGSMAILSAANSGKLKSFTLSGQTTGTASPKLLRLGPMDAFADITFNNGKKQKREYYYGSAYLSHSSRILLIPAGTKVVTITSYSGKSRQIKL
jgi:hypothetical protein